MPKYNIYKLEPDKKEELIDKFESVDMELTKEYEQNGTEYLFYLSMNPNNEVHDWATLYSDFIENPNNVTQHSHYGALIVSKDGYDFVVSLGKSHHYISKFCDREFSIELAKRIIDNDDCSVVSARIFGGRKTKTVSSYRGNSILEFDSNESIQYIKGKTLDRNSWGKKVTIGTSIQISVEKTPLELDEVIDNILVKMSDPPNFDLPHMEKIDEKELIEELDEKLIRHIIGNVDSEDDAMNIEFPEIGLSGVEFQFKDFGEYTIYRSREKYGPVDDLTIDDLRNFLNQYSLELKEHLDKIKIKIVKEGLQPIYFTLKEALEYIDNENNCLIDGTWYHFNEQYLDYLKRDIESIETELNSGDLSESEYQEWKTNLPITQKKKYRERYFNIKMSENGYIDQDTILEKVDEVFKVERMDLYNIVNDGMYFVKIGTPQKLGYAVDQAITSLRLFRYEPFLTIDGEQKEPKKVYLWFILDRQNPITKLTDINSIILLIKLNEWRKICINANKTPIVRIGYLKD